MRKLLAKPDPGWIFFKNCLLLLDPKDLKVCRQVCQSWNMFIKSKVWGSASGKRLLTKKLVNRWMTVEVRSEEVGTMEPESLVCNDRYIFCGHENGIVDVFSIA